MCDVLSFIMNGELIEVSFYCVVCSIVIALCLPTVLKDLRKSMTNSFYVRNDEYILFAVKIWSGIFIALVALLLIFNRTSLSLLQLNLFLIISLSGFVIDQMSVFPHLFVLASAVSWYELYFAFMNSPPGVSIGRLLEPKWIVAFYSMTSCVIGGHLKERVSVLNLRTSVFQLACIVFALSLTLPLESLCNMLTIKSNDYCSHWTQIPLRLEEMELGSIYRIVCIVFMCFLHFGTRFLILSADTEPVVDSKKTDDASPEDTPTSSSSSRSTGGRSTKSSPYHRYANMPSDIEGDVDANTMNNSAESGEGEVHGELPSDCVEVSEEEAVRLVEGPHYRGNSSSNSSSSGSTGIAQRK